MNNEELLKEYYSETEEKMRLRLLDLMLLDYELIIDIILKNIKEKCGKQMRFITQMTREEYEDSIDLVNQILGKDIIDKLNFCENL